MKNFVRRTLAILALGTLLPACGGSGGSGTLTPTIAPGIPSDLEILSGNQRLTLRWTGPTTGVTFVVLRSLTSGGPYFPVSVPGQFPTVTSYVDAGLTNGTTYYYRVFARNGFGTSVPSDEAEGTPAFKPIFLDTGLGYHTMAVFEDGSAWAWGHNSTAQLGLGFAGNAAYEPVEVRNLSDVTVVSPGAGFSLAIRSDGTVWGWGANTQGQLGLGVAGPDPVLVPTPIPALSSIIALSAGNSHSLALRVDGTVWAWGTNDNGEIGNGASGATPVLTPVQVSALSDVVSVAAGSQASMALKSDGTVWTWGSNQWGQLGDGSLSVQSALPVQVDNLNGVTGIAIGTSHNLAVRDDGTVWGWGNNAGGVLGNGTNPAAPVRKPVKANLNGATAVAAAAGHSLARTSDGLVWAWGQTNGLGALGNGSLNGSSSVPVQVVGLTGVTFISAGYLDSLARRGDGTVWAWGQNISLGIGRGPSSDVPVQADNLTGVTAVAAGGQHALALRADQSISSWGSNQSGQMGNGTTSVTPTPAPTLVANPTAVTKIAGGYLHSLAIRADGKIWAWGANSLGQSGNGNASILFVTTPAAVVGLTGTYDAISAGAFHSLAVRSDGLVFAWGYNQAGQLGNGSTTATPVSSPVQVINLVGATAVAGGALHSAALRNDGTVWCWGEGGGGQLGTGTLPAVPATSPVQAINLANVTAVSCGSTHSLALRNDGTVWSWGSNTEGQLGNGPPSLTPSPSPAQVPGLGNVVAIAAGQFHSVALRGDGTVWAWGNNDNGQLGNDTQTGSAVPIQVVNLTEVTAISAGQAYTTARKSDGSVWGWGSNILSELGVPYIAATAVPIIIPH